MRVLERHTNAGINVVVLLCSVLFGHMLTLLEKKEFPCFSGPAVVVLYAFRPCVCNNVLCYSRFLFELNLLPLGGRYFGSEGQSHPICRFKLQVGHFTRGFHHRLFGPPFFFFFFGGRVERMRGAWEESRLPQPLRCTSKSPTTSRSRFLRTSVGSYRWVVIFHL